MSGSSTYWQTAYGAGQKDASAYWAAASRSGSAGNYSSTADVYFQPDQNYSSQAFTITIYYVGGSHAVLPITISNTDQADLPLITASASLASTDHLGLTSIIADYYKDEAVTISNLPSYATIDHVDIRMSGSSTFWQTPYGSSAVNN
jgi:hypothetical protein